MRIVHFSEMMKDGDQARRRAVADA